MKKIVIALFFGISCSFNSFGQKIGEIDDALSRMFISLDTIQFIDSAALANAYIANEKIGSYLTNVLGTVPATIDADLHKSVENGLNICTSTDHKLRIYSWNSLENGEGTLKMTRKVYQYRSGNSIYVSDALFDDTVKLKNNFGLCYQILSINTNDKKTVYLEIDEFVDRPYHDETIHAIIIDKNHPLEYDHIEGDGAMSYSFDPKASYQNFKIHLSKDKKTLYVPRTDDNGIFHGYTTFTFNGEKNQKK